MPKEQALEILQRWQRDDALLRECVAKLSEDKSPEVLDLLKRRGLQVSPDDLVLALDAQWVMGHLQPSPVRPGPSGSFDLRLELQKGLVAVVRQIDEGFRRVMTMYTVAFYLGVVLVLTSLYAALALDSQRAALVLGGLGMADLIAAMIFRPAQDLQNSRGNLAQLQAAFFSWMNDVYNWNSYLLFLDRDASAKSELPAFDRLREVSEVQMRNIERMMVLVERYCEMYDRPGLSHKDAGSPLKAPPSPSPVGATVP